jgi:hypothetical protein
MITEYTRCGGDGGTTLKYLRMACGLKQLEAPSKGSLQPLPGITLATSADDDLKTHHAALAETSAFFARACMERGWNSLTFSYYKQIPMPSCSPEVDRQRLWDRFREEGLWIDIGSKGKSKEMMIPKIATKNTIAALFPAERGQCDLAECPEAYDLHAFAEVFFGNPARKMNADVMIEALDSQLNASRRRGKRTTTMKARQDEVTENITNCRNNERILTALSGIHDRELGPFAGAEQHLRLRGK